MNKKSFLWHWQLAALSAFPVCAQTIDVKGNAEPFTHIGVWGWSWSRK